MFLHHVKGHKLGAMSLPFYMYDVTSSEPLPTLRFLKKTVFEIKGPSIDEEDASTSLSQAPDFYMKCNESLRVRFGFQGGQYSAENEGTVVVYASQALGEAVMAVDAQVKEYFIDTYAKTRSNFGNAVWTEDAVNEMFKPSLWESAFRCKVTRDKTDFFDMRAQKLNYFIGCNRAQKDTNISIIVCPAFVWFKDRKIGVSWHARQIMCQLPGPPKAVYDPEIPDVDNDNVSEDSMNEPANTTPSWSLRNENEDDDEDDNNGVIEETCEIKTPQVSATWSINGLLNDEDEENKSETMGSKHVKSNISSTTPIVSNSWSLLDFIDEDISDEKTALPVKRKKKKVIVKKKNV